MQQVRAINHRLESREPELEDTSRGTKQTAGFLWQHQRFVLTAVRKKGGWWTSEYLRASWVSSKEWGGQDAPASESESEPDVYCKPS